MFKEIVDNARRTTDIGRSQKLTMSTLCSGELKTSQLKVLHGNTKSPTGCMYIVFLEV